MGFTLLIFSFHINACAQMTYEEKLESLYKHSVETIAPAQLEPQLQQGSGKEEVFILDIRSPKEYAISHLKNARMIDYENFDKSDVKDIPKNSRVIVYCSVGYRSERIGERLQKMGYKDVMNLYGGIFQWVNDGFEVINPQGQKTDSVHTYNEDWSQWLKKGVKIYE